MKFGFKTVILGSVLVLLLVSLVIQGYVMYTISNAKKFEVNSAKLMTAEGVNAADFWTAKRTLFVGPMVINLIGMGLLTTLYVMA
ncbi:hypothetical protein AVEN_261813-1 [Araneus ventricosus]|uniref:Uncharacterized protein n=1 Tax=Araneus ventricosus TaxID=182803 RepID=A0A4Y2LY94_ARAVE|nr:hypothetical protein AVEN_261813-1 [Araneus ventricosus]